MRLARRRRVAGEPFDFCAVAAEQRQAEPVGERTERLRAEFDRGARFGEPALARQRDREIAAELALGAPVRGTRRCSGGVGQVPLGLGMPALLGEQDAEVAGDRVPQPDVSRAARQFARLLQARPRFDRPSLVE